MARTVVDGATIAKLRHHRGVATALSFPSGDLRMEMATLHIVTQNFSSMIPSTKRTSSSNSRSASSELVRTETMACLFCALELQTILVS